MEVPEDDLFIAEITIPGRSLACMALAYSSSPRAPSPARHLASAPG